MKNLAHLGPVQNMGWFDRAVRLLIGMAMIVAVLVMLQEKTNLGGYAYLPIIAIYPLLTAILGWDPVYSASHVKSCNGAARNQCGTFPFEVESAMGKKPECNEGYDCSVRGNEHQHALHH